MYSIYQKTMNFNGNASRQNLGPQCFVWKNKDHGVKFLKDAHGLERVMNN